METSFVDAIGPALLDAASAAGIGILVAAFDGAAPRTVYVNDVTCGLVGRTAEDILARSMFDLVALCDRERMRSNHARRARGEVVDTRLEVQLLHESGDEIPAAVGTCVAMVASARVQVVLLTDMRDRRAAAERLRASERRFRDVVEGAPDGIVITRRAEILYANQAAEGLLGVSRTELVGRSLGEFLSPGDMARMRDRVAALAQGERLTPSTYVATRSDGSAIVAEIASIITEYEGTPAVLAFARDVSARHEMQAGLERAERLMAVGRLAAGMAHEINNPLAFISVAAEALERKLDGLLPDGKERDEITSLLQQLVRGSERVAGIVRDLKSFGREGGGGEERGPVEVESVLAAAIAMAEHEIVQRGRLIRSSTGESVLDARVLGEPRKLEQVFANLLVNAAQALPASGGGTIEVRVTASVDRVSIVVSDDGSGIAPEHLGRVFDPFFTTKPVGAGTGLGLSICHGIVTALGGQISIDSELGRGTRVQVELARAEPTERAAEAPVSSPPVSEPAGKRRARVLIVEDQEALSVTLSRLLSSEHEVETALRVAQATAKLAPTEPAFDVVLCDMLMPDGTGIDVYERAVRTRPELAPRFVFMTGGAFTSDVQQFLERVPNARLEKPFAISELEQVIAKVLG